MVSRRTRVASWIFRRDHPSRPKTMICCFFSSFKSFAMLREATYPPSAVNVLDVSSESMAAFGCSLRHPAPIFAGSPREHQIECSWERPMQGIQDEILTVEK